MGLSTSLQLIGDGRQQQARQPGAVVGLAGRQELQAYWQRHSRQQPRPDLHLGVCTTLQ
jgi:hypothetical protein